MRRLRLAMIGICLLPILALALGLLSLVYPDLVNYSLRTELAATGLVVGRANEDQMKERYGTPSRKVQEHINTKYEYVPSGIVFRFDSKTGLLNWVEFTGSAFHTGKGIKVGDPAELVRQSYGEPAELITASGLTRLRYSYGLRYGLEFWISITNEVEKVVFYGR